MWKSIMDTTSDKLINTKRREGLRERSVVKNNYEIKIHNKGKVFQSSVQANSKEKEEKTGSDKNKKEEGDKDEEEEEERRRCWQ